jgi:hypothetical protein
MPIGKGIKIRAKCPICARVYTVSLEHSTAWQQWQVYYCSACQIKFRLPRGWKKHILKVLGGKHERTA